MNRIHRLILALLLLGFGASAGKAASQLELDRDLKCSVRAGLNEYVREGGMVPLVIRFRNSGDARKIQVRSLGKIKASATFHIPAHRTARRCLCVPFAESRLTGFEFRDGESGRSLAKTSAGNRLQFSGRRYGSRKQDLVSVLLTESSSYSVNKDFSQPYELKRSTVSPFFLPDRWQGYSGIDILIIDYKVWRDPGFDPDPVIQWTAMGGMSLLLDVPEEKKTNVVREVAQKAPFVATNRRKADSDSGEDFHWVRHTSLEGIKFGIGAVIFVSKAQISSSHSGFFRRRGLTVGPISEKSSTHSHGGYMRHRYSHHRTSTAGHPKIPGTEKAPFWPVFLALTAFSLLVGPVGWWYLVARRKQGLLYYISAPALCILVMGGVIVADFFHEGFRPYASCYAVRFLDQQVKKSINVSQFGIYDPFVRTRGIKGSTKELAYSPEWGSSDMRNLKLEWREDGIHYPGLLETRRKMWFSRQAIGRDRRRLLIGEKDGKYWVENHLGCKLKRAYIHYGNTFLKVGRIEPGKKVAAQVCRGVDMASFQRLFTSIQKETILRKARPLHDIWANRLSKGNAYVAEASDGFEGHIWLHRFRPKKTVHLIFGVM